MKIMIVGAGGIGGYLAALLCRKCDDITLIARGKQLDTIREHGLTLISDEERFTVHPALCTDKPAEAGIQDVILLCTKGYGLAAAVDQVAPCVGPDTLLIPFLNGINTHARIAGRLNRGLALDGCIYVFSRIIEPGVILKTGSLNRLCMGIPGKSANEQPAALYALLDLMLQSGLNAEIPEDITREMWLKWSFNSTNGQACAYFNVPVGQVRENPQMYEFLVGLMDEILMIAKAEGVRLPADIREKHLAAVNAMPYESTPSIMRDLNEPGKPTEIDLLAGELCRLAEKHGLDVPYNRKVLERFKDRV